MARALRIEYPGAFHHVYSRGVAKQTIFQSDEDRERFLVILGSVVDRYNWVLHAYCLMGNHFHLLVETPDPNLSAGMRLLNGVYAQWYNDEHERVGHLFQGRFGSTLIECEEYLLTTAAYVVLNPVKAGLVEHPSQYRWSSYLSTAGRVSKPAFLTTSSILLCFADDLQAARRSYRDFIDGGVDDEVSKKLEAGGLCGSAEFCEKMQALIKDKRDIRDIPRRQRYAGRPPIEHILDGWVDKNDRNERIFKAVYEFGYTQKAAAEHLGLASSTISEAMGSYLRFSVSHLPDDSGESQAPG
jgi:putative transposase